VVQPGADRDGRADQEHLETHRDQIGHGEAARSIR
jgi:hypothetical protein